MTFTSSKLIPEVLTIVPTIFGDDRGYFFESFNEDTFNRVTGLDFHPVQDNESQSSKGVVRGLHFQRPPYAQAKLVRVVAGAVYDVAVDIRLGSPTYGQWTGALLTAENHNQFFIPRGFAHGFIALEDNTIFQYKCDNKYNKESEGAILYSDTDVALPWAVFYDEYMKYTHNLVEEPKLIVSEKDMNNKPLKELLTPFVYGE